MVDLPVAGVAMPRWLLETGPEEDVVLSTRCRLARNLEGVPFPWRATTRQRRETAQAALEAADASQVFAHGGRVRRDELNRDEIRRLVELRLCTADWWSEGTGRWLCAARDGVCSLLVNEEDHLRLQAIMPGLQVESSLDQALEAERQVSGRLKFAQSDEVGYLTASLSNAGTGLRVSVMLHLPALAASEELDDVLSAATELGSAVRGAYGEGSRATGALYQVSNASACSVKTYRIADRVRASAAYLVDAERSARRKQFGDETGRRRLVEATAEVIELLFSEEATQTRLLNMVSVLRLAAAERILRADLAECAAWVTIAGASPAPSIDGWTETYEAIQRTAKIRRSVRPVVRATGTFGVWRAEYTES